MKLILLLLPALFPLCQATKSELIPPVILVPGDGGSQIEARLDKPSIIHYLCTRKTDAWFDLWLNIELLVPLVIDCWVDNMRLVYNNVTRRTSNAPGVDTRVPGFGNTTTVEWLDPSMNRYTGYFKDMANTMVATLGYERGHSLRGAPFDFRRAPNEQEEYFVRLKWLVEDTYHRCNNQRVVLALHSMGGPMTWYFLKKQTQAWKDQYIEAVVGFAGAWGGSIKAVKVYAAGDNLGIYLLNALKVRAEQRSAASLAFLLPSRDLWGPEDVLIQTPTKNYTVNNFKDLFESLKLPDAYNMYLDTRDLLKGAPPPGVPIYCLYGVGIPTVEKLTYAAGKFPDSPNLLYGEGDGTVNLKSAQVCEGWSGKQKQPVHTKVFNKMEHMEILRTPETIQYFVDILKNITEKRKKLLEKRMQKREEERGDRGDISEVRAVSEVNTDVEKEKGQGNIEDGREVEPGNIGNSIMRGDAMQIPQRDSMSARQERKRKRWYNNMRLGRGGRRRGLRNEQRSNNIIGIWRSIQEEKRKDKQIVVQVL